MMKKRGQLTIFILIAIMIIAIIILFFLLRNKSPITLTGGNEESPESFLQNCIKDKFSKGVDLISSQGGYVSNTLNIGYDDKKVSYLCYSTLNYQKCINQEPVLITHLETEIKNYLSVEISSCWDILTLGMQEKGYTVNVKKYNYTGVKLTPGKAIIELKNAEIRLTKTEESLKYNKFRLNFNTKLYDLAVVVQEIVSQEAKFCNFENLGYMMIHPETKITEKTFRDETTIYIVEDRKTKEQFFFAVRSCAIPGGIG